MGTYDHHYNSLESDVCNMLTKHFKGWLDGKIKKLTVQMNNHVKDNNLTVVDWATISEIFHKLDDYTSVEKILFTTADIDEVREDIGQTINVLSSCLAMWGKYIDEKVKSKEGANV